MTNVELAKYQLQQALHSLEDLNEERLEYYNNFNYNNGDLYYNAGIVLSCFIGRGLLVGIVNDCKNLIK